MHIPDGFLGSGTSIPLIAVAATFIAVSFRKIRQQFFVGEKIKKLATPEGAEFDTFASIKLIKKGKEKIFNMLTIGSFIFILQMMDIPLTNGVAGHFLGGALAAIVLGPWLGFLTISIILILQAFLLADGGIVALGANIFTMGIIGSVLAYYIYAYLKKKIVKNKLIAGFFVAWISVVLASFMFFILTNDFAIFKWHIIYGIGEGIITVLVLLGFNYKNLPK